MIKPNHHPESDLNEDVNALVRLKSRKQSLPQLKVSRLVVDESLEGEYQVELEIHVKRQQAAKLNPAELLGTYFVASMQHDNGERHFPGLLTEFQERHTTPEYVHFFLRLESWMTLLKHSTNSRVFENKNAIEVLETLVKELNEGPYGPEIVIDDQTRREPTRRDFLVQYNESNYQLVKRLFEEEGIYFRTSNRDDITAVTLLDGDPTVHDGLQTIRTFSHLEKTTELNQPNTIQGWDESKHFQAGTYSAKDYHYQTPRNELDVLVPSDVELGPTVQLEPDLPLTVKEKHNHSLDHYLFGEGFVEPFNKRNERLDEVKREGQLRTILRTQRAESTHRVVRVKSTIQEMAPGIKFHRRRDFQSGAVDPKAGFLVTSVRHVMSTVTEEPSMSFDDPSQPGHSPHVGFGSNRISGEFSDDGMSYQNSFTCIPADVVFRPARRTPKPRIHGIQTALVVGPPNEEIHVDDLGRIRVRFMFDRSNPGEETELWVRVSQVSASNRWGAAFWPRVGDEVIVAFINGDPDQPLATGSLYHANHLPPYALPEHKTRSGFKTRSTPGGDVQNANEIRFEDKKGHEHILIHAERSLITEVEANERRSVGASRKTTIQKDDSLEVNKGDRSGRLVEGSDFLTIEKGDRDTTIVKGSDLLTIYEGDRINEIPEGQFVVNAEEILLNGSKKIQLRVGTTHISITNDSIVLSCGDSEIEFSPTQINKKSVQINSTAKGPHNLKGKPINLNC